MTPKRKVMYPGDEIGTSEEFIAGDYTYEKDGKILSSNFGFLELDRKERIAKIKPITSIPVTLKVGDQVIGVIYDLKEAMATVDIVRVIDRTRAISGNSSAAIHISKVANEYVPELNRAFKIGDIIRAKVIQVEPSIQLTTANEFLGVIKASCPICSKPLVLKGNELYCALCERNWQKKFAKDYGTVKIT